MLIDLSLLRLLALILLVVLGELVPLDILALTWLWHARHGIRNLALNLRIRKGQICGSGKGVVGARLEILRPCAEISWCRGAWSWDVIR